MSVAAVKPHLLIVEDDPELGPIMCDVLSQNWKVHLAPDLANARQAVATQIFAAAVVDRRLPDGEGTEFVAELRSTGNPLPVLMLTALGEVRDRVSGLDAGANDYLVKPFDFAELEARLRALTRDFSRAEAGIEIGGWTFYPITHTVQSPYSGRVQLTETESALLSVLATHPDIAFTRPQLLSAVFERGELEGSVDTYVHYLRRKTERELIDTVRGVGYRLGTPA